MPKFRVQDETGNSDSVAVIAGAIEELLDTKVTVEEFSKNFQGWFSKLTQQEFGTGDVEFFEKALRRLQFSIRDEAEKPIADYLAWDSDLVETVFIRGLENPLTFNLDELPIADWIKTGIAEPELADLLGSHEIGIPRNQVLFAVGAGAEYSPGRKWLELGGNFAAVMRPGFARWQELISFTRSTGGTLLVPVLKSKLVNCGPNFLEDDEVLADLAGLDAVQDLSATSGWLREVSSRYAHTTLGLWGYAPGPKHLILQAAMDLLAQSAMQNLTPMQLTLNWLGTPTESVVITSPSEMLVDASVRLQGPNYLWAKRSQRWRAELAHLRGFRTIYLILPPAYTSSVLSFRSLRIAYAGAEQIGIYPFKMELARKTALGLLLWGLHQPQPSGEKFKATKYAVSGGLWRLGTQPGGRWKWAFIFGLFKPWWKIKAGEQ